MVLPAYRRRHSVKDILAKQGRACWGPPGAPAKGKAPRISVYREIGGGPKPGGSGGSTDDPADTILTIC